MKSLDDYLKEDAPHMNESSLDFLDIQRAREDGAEEMRLEMLQFAEWFGGWKVGMDAQQSYEFWKKEVKKEGV